MKKLSNRSILVLFLIFVSFLIVGSATLSFQTATAQNMTVPTGNATTADNATGTTGAENATAEGSISSRGGSGDIAFWGDLPIRGNLD